MTYAQILGGVVKNVISLDDPGLLPIFSDGFDHVVDLKNMSPMPGIGWLYDGVNFSSPPQAASMAKLIVEVDSPTRDTLPKIEGSLIFNKDTKKLQYFDGTNWVDS